jgi:hypothetical protein
MKIRNLLRKLNDAVRPPHVGALQPTDITERGGTEHSAPNYVPSQQDEKQGEGRRLVDAEERQWVEYMPSQQDDRPPH